MNKLIFFLLLTCFLQVNANADVLMEYAFKPSDAVSSTKAAEQLSEAAAIWKQHGAKASVWETKAGDEPDHLILMINFKNFKLYRQTADEVMADTAYVHWKDRVQTTGAMALVSGDLLSRLIEKK